MSPICKILRFRPYIDKVKARRWVNLWADLDCRTLRRDPPEFFDLFVGKSDATDCPILPTMRGADPTESVPNSVDHDVKTGGDPVLFSASSDG